MLLKGVQIGLELREFDRMYAMRSVIHPLTKGSFCKKNQSYDRGFDSLPTSCICILRSFFLLIALEKHILQNPRDAGKVSINIITLLKGM